MVLEDVQPVLMAALGPHARSDHVGQAVEIVRLDSRDIFDLPARGLVPQLGEKDAGSQGELAEVHAELFRSFGQVQKVTGRGTNGRDAQVLHGHELAIAVAAGDRDHGRPKGFGRLVEAQPIGEQFARTGILQHVALVDAAAGQAADHQLGPDFQVAPGVGHDDRLAGRAGDGIHSHDLADGHGQHSQRVGVAQIGLGGEGELVKIVEVADIGRGEAAFLHALVIDRHVLVGPVYRLPQPLGLQPPQLLARDVVQAAGRLKGGPSVRGGIGGRIHGGVSAFWGPKGRGPCFRSTASPANYRGK